MTAAIEKLIRAAEEAGLDCDGRDLADVVWLAAWMQQSGPPAEFTAPPPQAGDEGTDSSNDRTPEGTPAPNATRLRPDIPAPEYAAVHLPTPLPSQGGRRGVRPFHAPAAGALPAKLALARSLRPLLRRVPSRTAWLLDEDETAQQIAATGVWMPKMRPAPERAFHLTLVVDDSVSMSVWARTASELRVLLRWMGAFRDLWMFRMNADGPAPTFTDTLGRPAERLLRRRVRAHPDGRHLLTAPPERGRMVDRSRVRAHPDGRHLLFVLSDCVSQAWRNGGVRNYLLAWAQATTVCLIEVLPEPMWAGTALARARKVRLRNPSLRPANRSLVAAPLDPWFDPPVPDGLRLPVATLEPAGLGSLARLLAGFSGGWSSGVVLGGEQEVTAAQGVPAELTADERVENFRRLASPTAARLAGLVAVSPVVSLQVIRLIRCALVPEARQVHEAEFLLGGLLYAVRNPEEPLADHDDLYFHFYEGVTERLLDAVPAPAWVDVLRHVSAHVERHLGELDGFRAFLDDPEATAESSEVSSSPFVRLAASRLVRLGGGYARWAQRQASAGEELRERDAPTEATTGIKVPSACEGNAVLSPSLIASPLPSGPLVADEPRGQAPTTSTVFISCSPQNLAFVERELLRVLQTNGFDLVVTLQLGQGGGRGLIHMVSTKAEDVTRRESLQLSKDESAVLPTNDWESEIQKELRSCGWFLLVMSPASAESEGIKAELAWALENRRGRVIPLLIEDCEQDKFPLAVRAIQYIDFRTPDAAARQRLLAVLGLTEVPAPSSTSMLVYPATVPEAPPPPQHPSWEELVASLKSLWFPVVGVPASGKTLWLVMAYDLLKRGTPPPTGHFTIAPADAAHDIFDRLSRNLREHRLPAATAVEGSPPLAFVFREPDRWWRRGSKVLVNLPDLSGEVCTSGLERMAARTFERMSGCILFLNPTAHFRGERAEDQASLPNRIAQALSSLRRLRVGQPVRMPIAVCLSKLDLLASQNPANSPFRCWLEDLRATAAMPIGLKRIEQRSRMCARMLDTLFPGQSLEPALRATFGNQVRFFPVSAVGFTEDQLGIEDLSRRTFAPFGVLEPLLWLLHASGYRVFR